ncbi:hypothetical protein LSCM1_00581 [Leishmania martiniquensis]|uniref:Uncharacterized protein n=1 Tax=Leishmania martiniquensis TaxID=1580590 RepID=A0A836FKR3_9TRYP|nr:hypothetical protein LSCM1_00581 [Leishmania martiniquensis]
MDASLTDVESVRGTIAAPMSFSLPQVFQSCTPDASATVSLNTSGGPQQLQHQPFYSKQQSENLHKTPLPPPPQYGLARSPSKDRDVRIEGCGNSASSGVQPNVPVSVAQATGAAINTVTSAEAQAVACDLPKPDAHYRDPIVSANGSESYATAAVDKDDSSQRIHVLVVFDKMFCVCFVPPALRATLKVGELVLCECIHGENIGTIVADVSALLAEVMRQCQNSMTPAAVRQAFTPSCERVVRTAGNSVVGGHSSGFFIAATAMYAEKARSGLPSDQRLRRLPCVLRRGTNRDKKRVYFARLRSNDALAVVHRILRSEPLVALSAEYQVNFACVTIYLGGDRGQCPWSAQQFEQLGNTLVDPLRSETVEFRFVSEQRHEELDLTRAVTGVGLSEMLYAAVANHRERQSGKGGPGSRGGVTQTPAASRPNPSILHSQQQQQPQHPAGQLLGTPPSMMTTYTGSSMWPPSVAALTPASYVTQTSTQPRAMGYALAPCVYLSQQQQPPPNVHPVTLPSHTITSAPPATSPLSLVQVHYPPIGQGNPAPGIYWANISTPPQPQRLESLTPPPPPPPPFSITRSAAVVPAYYYLVSSVQHQQQAVVPRSSSGPQRGPTILQAAALAAPSHVRPQTFLEVPTMDTERYQAVSCPLVLASNTTPYS